MNNHDFYYAYSLHIALSYNRDSSVLLCHTSTCFQLHESLARDIHTHIQSLRVERGQPCRGSVYRDMCIRSAFLVLVRRVPRGTWRKVKWSHLGSNLFLLFLFNSGGQ
jgi:hypothetical protein